MTIVRYAYALAGALLLGGTAASLTLQNPATAQTAQNEPGAIQAAAPRAGAPMSFADMVAKLQPAVVNISTKQTVTVQQRANPFEGTPFENFFSPFGTPNQGGGAPIRREGTSLGSGFIISPDGYIVTNSHVISAGARGATVDSINVTLPNRKEYVAKLVGKDVASDLAVLKINAPGPLPFVKFGDSTRARVGDWVVAIGNPFGLDGTVTAGIVSAVHRAGLGPYDRFIQTDASINRGNSGGPMFDLNGNVIGINSQIFGSETGGNIGIGFAIPAEDAKPVIDTLMRGGTIKRGYLGVGVQPVSDDIAAALGLPKNQGEIIGRVEAGGPGARAGLRSGDVVTRINGEAVTPDQTLSYMIANVSPGSNARLDLIRDGRPQTVNVRVGTRPPEEQVAALGGGDGENDGIPDDGTPNVEAQGASAIGVAVQPLTPQIAQSIGVDSTVRGVVISQVDPASDAAQKVRRGDVITAVNSVPVRTSADVARAVAQAKAAGRPQVLLNITRGRQGGGFIAVKIK